MLWVPLRLRPGPGLQFRGGSGDAGVRFPGRADSSLPRTRLPGVKSGIGAEHSAPAARGLALALARLPDALPFCQGLLPCTSGSGSLQPSHRKQWETWGLVASLPLGGHGQGRKAPGNPPGRPGGPAVPSGPALQAGRAGGRCERWCGRGAPLPGGQRRTRGAESGAWELRAEWLPRAQGGTERAWPLHEHRCNGRPKAEAGMPEHMGRGRDSRRCQLWLCGSDALLCASDLPGALAWERAVEGRGSTAHRHRGSRLCTGGLRALAACSLLDRYCQYRYFPPGYVEATRETPATGGGHGAKGGREHLPGPSHRPTGASLGSFLGCAVSRPEAKVEAPLAHSREPLGLASFERSDT